MPSRRRPSPRSRTFGSLERGRGPGKRGDVALAPPRRGGRRLCAAPLRCGGRTGCIGRSSRRVSWVRARRVRRRAGVRPVSGRRGGTAASRGAPRHFSATCSADPATCSPSRRAGAAPGRQLLMYGPGKRHKCLRFALRVKTDVGASHAFGSSGAVLSACWRYFQSTVKKLRNLACRISLWFVPRRARPPGGGAGP